MSFLKTLRQKNNERQVLWTGADDVDELFRAVEFSGEAGELLNAVKKVYRHEHSITGNTSNKEDLYENLVDEMGDVIITLDLLANHYGIDLQEAVKNKFNKTSKKVNIDVTID